MYRCPTEETLNQDAEISDQDDKSHYLFELLLRSKERLEKRRYKSEKIKVLALDISRCDPLSGGRE